MRKSQTQTYKTPSDWASLKRLILHGSDAYFLWRLCFFQTVRRQGLEHPRGIVDCRVTEFVKVQKSPEDLPRVIGWGLCDLSSRRIRWGLCVRDWVSSSLNTQPLQPDVQLRQQLELVYQIIVFTKLTGSISSTLSFPQVCCYVFVRICLKTLIEDFLNFLSSISSVCSSSSLCYPVFTLSVLCACLHFIMMTMSMFLCVPFWVLIPLQVVLHLGISSPANSSVKNS